MSDSDRIEFTVRLYPREIVYWDDPRHPRFTDPNWSKNMGYPSDDEIHEAHMMPAPPSANACIECGEPLPPANLTVADGCPCNSPRGVNHGRVPTLTCTCDKCDPAQTGASRWPRGEMPIEVAPGIYQRQLTKEETSNVGPLVDVKQPGLDPTTDAIAEQNRERNHMRIELAEMEHSFELMRDADARAIAMWHEAHPGNAITFPDRAHLIMWLLEQLDTVTGEADKLRASGELFNALKTPAGQSHMQMFDQFKAELEEPLRKEIEQLRATLVEVTQERDAARFRDKANSAFANSDQIRRLTVERDDLKRANNEFPEELAKLKREIETLEDRRAADAKAIERMAIEAEQNRRQIDALQRQRDAAVERFNAANANHAETSDALAVMTIKWLTLANETKRDVSNLFDAINKTSADLRAARAEVDELKQARANHERHNGDLAAARILIHRAVEALPPKMRESYGKAKLPEAIAGLVEMRDAWEKTSDDLSEQLRVADADRIPLAQDLQIVRDDLKTAKESIGRMADLCKAAQAYVHGTGLDADHGITEAVDAYEVACSQAADEGADPSQEEMPF